MNFWIKSRNVIQLRIHQRKTDSQCSYSLKLVNRYQSQWSLLCLQIRTQTVENVLLLLKRKTGAFFLSKFTWNIIFTINFLWNFPLHNQHPCKLSSPSHLEPLFISQPLFGTKKLLTITYIIWMKLISLSSNAFRNAMYSVFNGKWYLIYVFSFRWVSKRHSNGFRF